MMSLSNRKFLYTYHVSHYTFYGPSLFFSCRRGLLLQEESWAGTERPGRRCSETPPPWALPAWVPGTELGALCSYRVYSSHHPCEIDALITFSR